VTIERLRGRALQAQRKRIWLQDPRCAHCRKMVTLHQSPSGFELDHIIALTNDGTNDDANMQALCYDCHETKTAEDLGYTPKVEIGIDGWPAERTEAQSRTARWKRVARG
jgi:5-methylcytosine-specific restriction protein A